MIEKYFKNKGDDFFKDVSYSVFKLMTFLKFHKKTLR
jgi:hypothetical protein